MIEKSTHCNIQNYNSKMRFYLIFITGLLLTNLSFGQVNIILETDMESDMDDAAALGMLHAMADNGECEILAVMHNTSDTYGVGMIDVINTYYNRPDIPIGSYKGNDAYSWFFGSKKMFARAIVTGSEYGNDMVTRKDAPPALDVYKKILSAMPQKSVVIVSVGWTINLRDLIKDREGNELVKEKVEKLVLMGGSWNPPDSASRRVQMNLLGNQVIKPAYESGKFVVENWPTPIVFSGLVGKNVKAGSGLWKTPKDNPVRKAYRIGFLNWGTDSIKNYHTADLTTVLYAVRGESNYWKLHTQGTPRIILRADDWCPENPEENKYLHWNTVWDSSVDSQHAFLKFATEPEKIAEVIENLITQLPKDRR
jgi:hypothetical protein